MSANAEVILRRGPSKNTVLSEVTLSRRYRFIKVVYDAPAKLAYESSDKSAYNDFKT
jgi:hypothetical protein